MTCSIIRGRESFASMEKAYDCSSWGFVDYMLKRMGLKKNGESGLNPITL